jgi:hypothetical protein
MATKSGKKWSASDVQRMRRYARAGLTSKTAAVCLRRSWGATRYKACMIGVNFRSYLAPRRG